MSENKKVALALGSNLGDRRAMFKFALEQLELAGLRDIHCGRVLESVPVDCPDGSGVYLNSALIATWSESAEDLLGLCLDIEARAGRRRTGLVNEARYLDLDVLLFDDERYVSDDLQVPHPRMHLRDFVLVPLVDVAPDWIHPEFNKSVSELLEDLT